MATWSEERVRYHQDDFTIQKSTVLENMQYRTQNIWEVKSEDPEKEGMQKSLLETGLGEVTVLEMVELRTYNKV